MKFDAISIARLNLSKGFWIGLGVSLWLYVVISHIPAAWGAYFATRSGDLAMSGVTGTVWSGQASLASAKFKGVDHSLGQLTWKLDVLSLLVLKPCAQLTTQMDNQQFEGHVCGDRKGGFVVTNASASFPAPLLQQVLPLSVDGQLSLNIDRWEMNNNQLGKLNAKGSWQAARVFNGGNWMSFGNMGAELSDDGAKGLRSHIFDVNSPVHVDLAVSLLSPSGGSIKGVVSMPEPVFRDLNASAWLSMFAIQQPNDAQGNINYKLDTPL